MFFVLLVLYVCGKPETGALAIVNPGLLYCLLITKLCI
jgi:hypothetical protein